MLKMRKFTEKGGPSILKYLFDKCLIQIAIWFGFPGLNEKRRLTRGLKCGKFQV